MGTIPAAKQSPRIENDILKWYEGDTFTLNIELVLKDDSGSPVTITSTDTVTAIFYNERGDIVKTFTFQNITGNVISIEIDSESTSLFTKGKYIYDIKFSSSNLTTIANDNVLIVE